jgi:large subunit ribosomal protein L21
MYAVVKDGGREFRVKEGDTVLLDRKEIEPGTTYSFSDVLLVSDGVTTLIGQPTLDTASVTGTVVEEVKGKKLVAFKYRRRKKSKTKKGHRQRYTKVEINTIRAEGIAAPAPKPEPEPEKEVTPPAEEETKVAENGA